MNFLDDVKYNVVYECINQTILNGKVMSISLIKIEINYGAIDADNSTYHGYYTIRFYSSPYMLQADLNICGQFIYSG